MTTIYDIAKEMNVSVSTVSKALNDDSKVNIKTREEVKAKAKAMGYSPNQTARSLTRGHSNLIGVVFSAHDRVSFFQNPFLMSILDIFKTEISKSGHEVVLLSHKSSGGFLSYSEVCQNYGVKAVVVFGDCSAPRIRDLVDKGIRVISFEGAGSKIVTVTSDNKALMRSLTEIVLANGHTHLTYIKGDPGPATDLRTAGFLMAVQHAKNKISSRIVQGKNYDIEAGNLFTDEAIKMGSTAILYPDDISAIGGINHLAKSGISVPGSISVTGFDGTSFGQLLSPSLTTAQQNFSEIGRLLAASVVGALRSERLSRKTVIAESKILKGDSVGPVKTN